MYKIQAILCNAENPITAKDIAVLIETELIANIKDFTINNMERRSLHSRVRAALVKLEQEEIAVRVPETHQVKNFITFKWKVNEIQFEREVK